MVNTVSKIYVSWGIRSLQVIFTIINLGLIADVLNDYDSGGAAGFGMFVDVFTLVYFIVIFSLAFTKPELLIPGVLITIEAFITIIWFISFIVWGAHFGGVDCSYYSFYFNEIIGVNSSACHVSKAVIAFGIFIFILFLFSTLIIGIEVLKPLHSVDPSLIWKTGSPLNKPVLALVTIPETTNDDNNNNSNKETKEEPDQEAAVGLKDNTNN